MALSDEDKKKIRAIVRGEINKAVGTIMTIIEKNNPSRNALTRMVTQALIKAQREAEAETKTGAAKEAAEIYAKGIPEDARLETF